MPYFAKFYDGDHAKAYDVMLEAKGANTLIIRFDDGRADLKWHANSIRLLNKFLPPQPARFGHKCDDDVRLELHDAKTWKYVELFIKNSPEYRQNQKKLLFNVALLAALFVVVCGLSAQFSPRVFSNLDTIVPASLEEVIGYHAVKSVSADHKNCKNKDGLAALEVMTARLLDDDDVQVDIRIIDQPDVSNAFAFPGGYIIIFNELIEDADSAEEVAGVLAHEIAHIKLRHPIKAYMKNLGMMALAELIFSGSGLSDAVFLMSSLNFSRDDEIEADLVGYEYLKNANIDPSGIIAFFDRHKGVELSANNKALDSLLSYASTHPQFSKRIEMLSSLKERADQDYQAALSEQEWQALKDICK